MIAVLAPAASASRREAVVARATGTRRAAWCREEDDADGAARAVAEVLAELAELTAARVVATGVGTAFTRSLRRLGRGGSV